MADFTITHRIEAPELAAAINALEAAPAETPLEAPGV